MTVDISAARIAALLKDVTPGQWQVHVRAMVYRDGQEVEDSLDVLGSGGVIVCSRNLGYSDRADKTSKANAAFIAAAREIVPAMAARIAELQAEVENRIYHLTGILEAEGTFCACAYDNLTDVCLGHHAAMEELRKQDKARIAVLEAALVLCRDEIDGYIRAEYPSDHPHHESKRQLDFAANPARAALKGATE